MGSEHRCIYHAFKNVGTYQSIQSSKQSFRIVFKNRRAVFKLNWSRIILIFFFSSSEITHDC